MSAAPLRVLIAGGGVAGIEAALAVRSQAPDVSVELVTLDAGFEYRQLSVVEPFSGPATRQVPYEALRRRGVTVTRAGLAKVDAEARRAVLTGGAVRRYDALVVATGAARKAAFVPAITFSGAAQASVLRDLVSAVERGDERRVAFVVPPAVTWPLPLYELALQLGARAGATAELRVLTPERAPLDVFGAEVGAHVAGLLAGAGIALDAGVEPKVPGPGTVFAGDRGAHDVDRVVALPVLMGRRTPGLPATDGGFLPVDADGRVTGTPGVYAAGDGTAAPIKQGGLAAQHADRAAAALLADAGFDVPAPDEPLTLRAVLITGGAAWYLRRRLTDPHGEASPRPLWWPPAKVVGHHLSPFLDGLSAGEEGVSLERTLAAASLEGDA